MSGQREPDPRLRHPERGGERGDGEPRALVVGPELVRAAPGVVLGDAAEGLERRRGVALDREALAQHAVGARHRAFEIAVGEDVVPHDVAAELRVEDRRVGADGRSGSSTAGSGSYSIADPLEGVLGGGAVHRGHRGHRLAGVARAIHGQAVVGDGGGGGDERADRIRLPRGVRAGDHGVARRAASGVRACPSAGMRAWACGLLQHRRVEHPRPREIVDEAAPAGDQPRVLLERDRGPDPAAGAGAHAVRPGPARRAPPPRRERRRGRCSRSPCTCRDGPRARRASRRPTATGSPPVAPRSPRSCPACRSRTEARGRRRTRAGARSAPPPA